MQKRIRAFLLSALVLSPILYGIGCGSSMEPTRFANPQFDFGFVQRVAVLPFENLSNDRQAGFRATRLTITEILASGALDVVEPGEVQAAIGKIPGRIDRPSQEQILTLGQDLGVQALILGTVAQSEVMRSGAISIPVVTLDMQMVETETAVIVWAATHTEKGGSFNAKVLGTGGVPMSTITRRCVQETLETLIQ